MQDPALVRAGSYSSNLMRAGGSLRLGVFQTPEWLDGSLDRGSSGFSAGEQPLRPRQTIGSAKIDLQLPGTSTNRAGTSTKSERNFQRIPAPACAFSKLRVYLRCPRFSDQSPHGNRGAIASFCSISLDVRVPVIIAGASVPTTSRTQ